MKTHFVNWGNCGITIVDMPRQKLSEYRSKCIISKALELPYKGWQIDAKLPLATQLKEPEALSGHFVVKVDEGVKGRFKKGLVLLDVPPNGLDGAIKKLAGEGYHSFIIEPMAAHSQADERYISLMSDREGILLQYTASGGVDIEQHAGDIQKVRLDEKTDWQHIARETGITATHLHQLVSAFTDNYFVFLEINPYLAADNAFSMLDAAVEVDDAAEFFVDSWRSSDFRRHSANALTDQELVTQTLNANSPASFSLSLLQPNGGIFLLLSGGGASVVVADEVYNRGLGTELANYGEYSGNPNAEETYAYTKAVLQLLLNSSAKHKVLFIGGAVANFTDIAKTFAGVIRAISEVADKLKAQHVKVFVRRGGPNQATGLGQMQETLTKYGLLGAVHDPGTPLTTAVGEALGDFL